MIHPIPEQERARWTAPRHGESPPALSTARDIQARPAPAEPKPGRAPVAGIHQSPLPATAPQACSLAPRGAGGGALAARWLGWLRAGFLLLAWLSLPGLAPAQTVGLLLPQTATLVGTNFALGINWQSYRGVPLSSTKGSPPGSDGRYEFTNGLSTFPPTPGQFQGLLGFSAIPAQSGTTLTPDQPFAADAVGLGWPHETDSSGNVALVLRSAQVGAPYLGQSVSYLFGAQILPPTTDENGLPLSAESSLNYWFAMPYTTDNFTNAQYYWSPNAQAVFASQSGVINITWEKQTPTNGVPPDYADHPSKYLFEAGLYYTLYTPSYLISTTPVKTPQKMYWTYGTFENTGHPVSIPAGAVSSIHVAFNNVFPETVATAYVDPNYVPPVNPTNSYQEVRTLWLDETGLIQAYNTEGRVFVELLGQATPEDGASVSLGFEIVDVFQSPTPVDITNYLGEVLTAYQGGTDGSGLYPAPIVNATETSFYYEQDVPGSTTPTLYADRATVNLNDFEAYWLITGVAGLQWPYLFDRYHLVWPSDPAMYSFYLRPPVGSEVEAELTGVQLPPAEAPTIDYQDPLDQPRATLTPSDWFYTWLTPDYPAERALLRFNSGNNVSFERVFSLLDAALETNYFFAGSVATNLTGWNPTTLAFDFSSASVVPYVVTNTVNVGDRISAPAGELGGTGAYWAGYIDQTNGTSFNPGAYVDPFAAGFTLANQGAIIPVNAIPGTNMLEVWWFRSDNADTTQGFLPVYWPTVIGWYSIQWPANTPEIILASNAGSGPLDSLQAAGSIYVQNDPTQPGYNPNEEHAQILGGQVYALRDDLNITNVSGYSSAPYVLLNYTAADGRPAMSVFHVRREAPEQSILFDYITQAGTFLQAPMPLPLMPLPMVGSGPTATNCNREPSATSGDLPLGWNGGMTNGPYAIYPGFTFQDRNHDFWVYRGLHAGLPPLQAGAYNTNNNTFNPLPAATAVLGQPFAEYIHVSRQTASLTIGTPGSLPPGLLLQTTTNGLALTGAPTVAVSNWLTLVITDTADNSVVTNTLSLNVVSTGTVAAQGPLAITSTNQYSEALVTYTNRPPFLAQAPTPTNSFTMQFYYVTQDGFAWPGVANPPPTGSIVPYLRPVGTAGNFVGDPTSSNTPSLNIVYRPVWPEIVNNAPVPTLYLGQTLTEPINNLPAVRGQSSVNVLYQQSIGLDITNAPASVVLYDPTVQKTSSLAAPPLSGLPASVNAQSYQGRMYFPNLPPNLVNRVFFDPDTTNLVFQGQFVQETVGPSYILLNVLRGADLAAIQGLCPASDTANSSAWNAAVTNLAAQVYTFYQNPAVPGSYVANTNETVTRYARDLVQVTNSDTQVDSYALCATGPGEGYISFVTGNAINPAQAGQPVSVYVARVAPYAALNASPSVFPGTLEVIFSPNPLSQLISFQHTSDLAGDSDNYQYDWRIAPPVNGEAPITPPDDWPGLTNGLDLTHFTLGATGVQGLSDNYIALRYRTVDPEAAPATTNWSAWTTPQLAEGYIKRVLQGINPFDQVTTDLFDNPVNTSGSIIEEAGASWQGDVALNASTLTNVGLIAIYETVLHQGENVSINAGINYGPANDALLLAAGELCDLYMYIGNDAWANSLNPTISIGTDDVTYGQIATALFCFQGEVASLLQQNLCLLRGRDDSLSPGVTLSPVFNRLYWNYTYGIAAGEVIYALNYNIQDENGDGVVNAADAAILYPMGHGDAYGHYLTAIGNYWSLLMNPCFDWVPQAETVTVLGAAVSVNYQHERNFASAAGALATAGEQVFDLTWRQDYQPGTAGGWSEFGTNIVNYQRPYLGTGGTTNYVTEYWGLDHWGTRVGQGAFLNWVVGNAILPPVDPNPLDQGIQKVDRTTVPELTELPQIAAQLQTDMDNAEAGFTPLGLPQNAIPFDINPLEVTGSNPLTHFEQIYERAVGALNNAVVAFDAAQNVTEDLREEQNSLADFQAGVDSQELAFNNQLIEVYGTPYPDDVGPGKTYPQGYNGPDLIHYTYVENPDTQTYGGILPDPTTNQTFEVDIQQLPANWLTNMYESFGFINESISPDYTNSASYTNYITFTLGPNGFFGKPSGWTSTRATVGTIQQSISSLIAAQDKLRNDLAGAVSDKQALDKAMQVFIVQSNVAWLTLSNQDQVLSVQQDINQAQADFANESAGFSYAEATLEQVDTIIQSFIPSSLIFGTADGGDELAPAAAAANIISQAAMQPFMIADLVESVTTQNKVVSDQQNMVTLQQQMNQLNFDQTLQNQVLNLASLEGTVQNQLLTINQDLRSLSDAQGAYSTQVSSGNQIQQQRLTYRQHAAALTQQYRTEDAAFLLFQNEDLQRYKTLFNLAAEYAYLAANAYDYETGLLNTEQGQALLNQIVSSQALGVIQDGQPQFAGSSEGDPGLSSALAEMYADWSVLKGRLGFNNPDGNGTIVSLRTENYRILPTSDGDNNWVDVLQQGLMPNILADSDVERYCMQIDDGSGLPVPGIVLTFGTTIADGYNLFGQPLAAGDHDFSESSFATKIFAVGVDFDGYIGMDNPVGTGAVTNAATAPNALAATPYVYLIPVGVDSMRAPPLGDTSAVRTWAVDDLAVPLPFNVSANDFASNPMYTSANSLTEPLFTVRKHQAFRPVSTTAAFNTSIYGADGALQPSQYTNSRLIGRSVWNSKWKLVIPGTTLLSDPNQGLTQFINTVKDVKLYFITYSYSGN
jgi:hypothetical protein